MFNNTINSVDKQLDEENKKLRNDQSRCNELLLEILQEYQKARLRGNPL
jgi:uncharacterized membrane-anchored protein YhcB (DUF1043 family)